MAARQRYHLRVFLGNKTRSGQSELNEIAEATDEKLRFEGERFWRDAHETRRSSSAFELDSYIIDRLVKHDVECFLGVIGKRASNSAGDLGYVEWWLTFDKTVSDFEGKLRESLGVNAPKMPTMSPDFLGDYLAVGPMRGRVAKDVDPRGTKTNNESAPAIFRLGVCGHEIRVLE